MSQYSQTLEPDSTANIVWQVLGGKPGAHTDPGKVKEKLAALSYYWQWHKSKTEPLDFSDPDQRKAYVYRYLLCNMKLTYCVLDDCKELGETLSQPVTDDVGMRRKFKVACIGGGPGSDMLGVILYLQQSLGGEFMPQYLSIKNYDKCSLWDATWSAVLEETIGGMHTSFTEMDVTSKAALEQVRQNEQFAQFDLFTMVRFCSELRLQFKDEVEEKASPFFRELFKRAKPGAFFVLIDNKNPLRPSSPEDRSTAWLCNVAREMRLELLQTDDVRSFIGENTMTPGEKMSVLFQQWKEALDSGPQLDLTCLLRVWKKRSP